MAALRDRQPDFTRAGLSLTGLSVDPPDRSRVLREALSLPFPLLSDTDREIVTAWRLLNTHEHGGIAFPAMFVLDAARRVGFRSLDRTVYRVDFAAVMDFIEKRAPATEAAPHRCGVIPAFRDFAGATRSAIRLGIRVPVRRG